MRPDPTRQRQAAHKDRKAKGRRLHVKMRRRAVWVKLRRRLMSGGVVALGQRPRDPGKSYWSDPGFAASHGPLFPGRQSELGWT